MNMKYVNQEQINAYFANLDSSINSVYNKNINPLIKKSCKKFINAKAKLKYLTDCAASRINDEIYNKNNYFNNQSLVDSLQKGNELFKKGLSEIVSLDNYSRLFVLSKNEKQDFNSVLCNYVSSHIYKSKYSSVFLDNLMSEVSIKDVEKIFKVRDKYYNLENKLNNKVKGMFNNNFTIFLKHINDKGVPLFGKYYSLLVEMENIIDNFDNNNGGGGLSDNEMIKILSNLPNIPNDIPEINTPSKQKVKQKIALKEDGTDEFI